jgi:DNA-binding IscR family transcriptional regulator
LNDLKGRLTKELQQDFNVKIVGSLSWSLPVNSIEIEYQTVMRTKVDILMKMMLIAFGKADIATAEELSDILLVEQLFIDDLIDKMSRTGVIEKREGFYSLTDVGVRQFKTGIFVHEPESGSTQALYSPCHQTFLNGEIKNIPYEEKELYRFKNEIDDWSVVTLEDSVLIDALKTMDVESSDGNVQIVVSEIVSASDIQVDLVPCIEFHLYNEAEDLLYARVWNTLSEHWDETLEAQLNEKERKKWREIYL